MSDDIVGLLRSHLHITFGERAEAADEIERLRDEGWHLRSDLSTWHGIAEKKDAEIERLRNRCAECGLHRNTHPNNGCRFVERLR